MSRQPASEPVEVVYEAGDFRALYRACRRCRRNAVLLLIFVPLFFTFLCYVGGDRGVDLAYSAVPFILIIFMVQLACYFLGPLMTMRTRRKTGWQMPMSIQLTTEGVSVSHPSQSLVAYWPAIQDVVVKRKRLFLFTTPACAIIVPRRAFASDEQFDRWVGEAEALWAAARGHG